MKHVLITGGTDGLGKVTAEELIKKGHRVTILSRDMDKTESTAKELGCDFVVADVSSAGQVEKAIDEAEKNAPLDVLINNAGLWIQGPLDENKYDYIQKVMDVNAVGPIYCTKAVAGYMKKRKSGRIINISSQGGLYAKSERSVYTASKWALTGFTRALQAELKPFGISVVGMFPGAINQTEIFNKAGNSRDMSKAMDPISVANAIIYAVELPDEMNIPEFGLENLAY